MKTRKQSKCCSACRWSVLGIIGGLVVLAGIYFAATHLCHKNFKYVTEQFDDMRILRYQVAGFDKLTPQEKGYMYYLYEASLAGRDIIYDQNYKHNLFIRRALEAIVMDYEGDRNTEDFKKFMNYTKKVWISNGIHHYRSDEKMIPAISPQYFADLIKQSPKAKFPLKPNETMEAFLARITPLIFDPKIDFKKITRDPGIDIVKNSAVNFYDGVTQKEVEDYYARITDPLDPRPMSYGLNSKLIKINDTIVEIPWKIGGMYSAALEKTVAWLKKAITVAPDEQQKAILAKLIEYYQTGDLRTFDEYSILWAKNTPKIDLTQGFIEVYLDPLGRKGSYQSLLVLRDEEATKRATLLGNNAQWFEDHLPVNNEFKKKETKAVLGLITDQVLGSGDVAPPALLGQNLPNPDWIRNQYGSKSSMFANIAGAYDEAAKETGVLKEFSYSNEVVERAKKFGLLSDSVHTDMHEILGHASGLMKPGVGEPSSIFKSYYNAFEETRAELIALYYMLDPKLMELKIFPSVEAGKACYDNYITNGLMKQLGRMQLGQDLTEAHMQSRHLVASWALEHGQKDNVIEKKVKDGKTYFVVNDYDKLRQLFGQLLSDVQRIKSEGDFDGAKNLVETYAKHIDPVLHKEVKDRWAALNVAPNMSFIQAKLVPEMKGDKIVDVKIEYPDDLTTQMMEYAEKYSFLPTYN